MKLQIPFDYSCFFVTNFSKTIRFFYCSLTQPQNANVTHLMGMFLQVGNKFNVQAFQRLFLHMHSGKSVQCFKCRKRKIKYVFTKIVRKKEQTLMKKLMWSKRKIQGNSPHFLSRPSCRQTELLCRLANRLHWKFTLILCFLSTFQRPSGEKKKKKKNESINKALFSSTEEDHFLVCYVGSLTFILYFANTKNYNLCGKGKCI